MTTAATSPEVTILPESVDELARGIVFSAKSIRAWLDQPDTKAKYQQWLAERRARSADAVQPPANHAGAPSAE